MTRNIIWVTGLAASGKTVVINELSKYLSRYKLLGDAEEMLRLNKEDVNHLHHIHPKGDKGFLLTSSHHTDESIRRIVAELHSTEKFLPFLIEIARGMDIDKYVDLSYQRFMELIPQKIFHHSIILYLQSSWQVRLSRNTHRQKGYFVGTALKQSFYVPQEAMKKFFQVDDFTKVKEKMPCPIYIIDNNSISKTKLKQKIASFVKKTQFVNCR